MKKLAFGLICVSSMIWSFAAQAQQAVWVKVAVGNYLGGTGVMTLPFDIPVESSQIALTVPAFCAPRALASRAVILEDDSSWTRTVDLRFMRQERFNGYIRAFYTVDASWGRNFPLVNAVTFSFTQVQNSPSTRTCPINIFALHGQ
jgi:hypothetical protein